MSNEMGVKSQSARLVVNIRRKEKPHWWFIFFVHCWVDTWSLTLAVSRGNVTMSAIQAAAPALAIFTPSGGGTSEGLSPTMVTNTGVKVRNTQKHTGRITRVHFLESCHINIDGAVNDHVFLWGYDQCGWWWCNTYSVLIRFKGSFGSTVVCCRAGFDRPDCNPYRASVHRKERCIFCSVFIYHLAFFFYDIPL